MRISDWSSTCALPIARDRLARRVECTLNGRFRRMKNGSSGYLPVESGNRWGTSWRLCICHSHHSAARHPDRLSVVSGTRVSVLLALVVPPLTTPPPPSLPSHIPLLTPTPHPYP